MPWLPARRVVRYLAVAALATGATGVSLVPVGAAAPSPPTVTGLSPDNGTTAGGTALTVSGTGFDGVESVTVGGDDVGFKVLSGSTIEVVTPRGSGSEAVAVTTGGGTSAATSTDQFTYDAADVAATLTSEDPPAITLPDAAIDQSYRQQLAAAPDPSATTWQLTSGALPPGLHLDGDGLVSGRADKVGLFLATVEVANPSWSNQLARLVISVDPAVALTESADAASGYWQGADTFSGVVGWLEANEPQFSYTSGPSDSLGVVSAAATSGATLLLAVGDPAQEECWWAEDNESSEPDPLTNAPWGTSFNLTILEPGSSSCTATQTDAPTSEWSYGSLVDRAAQSLLTNAVIAADSWFQEVGQEFVRMQKGLEDQLGGATFVKGGASTGGDVLSYAVSGDRQVLRMTVLASGTDQCWWAESNEGQSADPRTGAGPGTWYNETAVGPGATCRADANAPIFGWGSAYL